MFDETEVGPGADHWGDETVKWTTLIKSEAKWALQSWTTYQVTHRRAFLSIIVQVGCKVKEEEK